MKIKMTEIEASAEELRQSNSLSDGLTRLLRNAFNPVQPCNFERDDDEDDDEQTERSE